ncbi:cupin domain-containing protein [Streptomyces sp. NPDC051322]|uniref:cupin domain-containing protein n=1 Tax=Streptomyces sp. NPDC051322 TaxID=3154645 RepID=UPI00344CB45C
MSAAVDGEETQPGLVAVGPLRPHSSKTPRMRSRWIKRPERSGWDSYAISEWELSAAGFMDLHPHDETNLVLAGELHVEVNGVEVVGRAGDWIDVPAGSTGRYWAPHYARMVAIYGPNPDGAASEYLEYWEIGDSGTTTETDDSA